MDCPLVRWISELICSWSDSTGGQSADRIRLLQDRLLGVISQVIPLQYDSCVNVLKQ
jgi:hypothetical protein